MKKLTILVTLGIGLLGNSLLSTSAKAGLVPLDELKSIDAVNSPQDQLIAQLRGHDVYDGKPQIEWNDYLLGRVIGEAGSIKFIKVSDGGYFHASGSAYAGEDVLVEKVDGGYKLIGRAHTPWISKLEANYGYKRVAESSSLKDRTASLWKALEANKSTTSTTTVRKVTPMPTSAPVEYTPEPVSEPIRGLY